MLCYLFLVPYMNFCTVIKLFLFIKLNPKKKKLSKNPISKLLKWTIK